MYLKYFFVFGFALLLGSIGCARHTTDAVRQTQLPLGKEYKTFQPPGKLSELKSNH